MSIVNSRSMFPSLFEKVSYYFINMMMMIIIVNVMIVMTMNIIVIIIFILIQGFVVRPGHENLVAMGAISTKADPDIIGQ